MVAAEKVGPAREVDLVGRATGQWGVRFRGALLLVVVTVGFTLIGLSVRNCS